MYPTLNIFLADGDIGDCLFFKENSTKLKVHVQCTTATGCKQLNYYLSSNINIPDVVFPDLNRLFKIGFIRMMEIKKSHVLEIFPW